MFTRNHIIRMNDTDSAGVLYFANQFRLAHAVFEDFMISEGFCFKAMVETKTISMAIVHTESHYFKPIKLSDNIHFTLGISKLGTTSFTTHYDLYKENNLSGITTITHCCIDKKTKKKKPIPSDLKTTLSNHLLPKPLT